jgi:hypothetical protein
MCIELVVVVVVVRKAHSSRRSRHRCCSGGGVCPSKGYKCLSQRVMTKCEQSQHREQVQQHDKTRPSSKSLCFFLVFHFVPKTGRRKEGVIRPLVRVGLQQRSLLLRHCRYFKLQSSNTFTTGIPDWIAGFCSARGTQLLCFLEVFFGCDAVNVALRATAAVRGSVERRAYIYMHVCKRARN